MQRSAKNLEIEILKVLTRTRGVRLDLLMKFNRVVAGRSQEALRKHLERMCVKGLLAKSAMPSGSQLFRFSKKGSQTVGAPASWAQSPSSGVVSEIVSVCAVAGDTDKYLFLTREESQKTLSALGHVGEIPKLPGRLVFRSVELRDETGRINCETHLKLWISELRPPEHLAKRVHIIAENLQRHAVFARLIEARVFGLTLAVPSLGVKASLEILPFPVPTEICVVEELQSLLRS
jgi:hypothetical protein